jgi:hypothetical protein
MMTLDLNVLGMKIRRGLKTRKGRPEKGALAGSCTTSIITQHDKWPLRERSVAGDSCRKLSIALKISTRNNQASGAKNGDLLYTCWKIATKFPWQLTLGGPTPKQESFTAVIDPRPSIVEGVHRGV